MRIILDTNVLLDGIFLEYSNSRKLFSLIQDKTIDAYVIRNTLYESMEKIRRIKKRYGYDLNVQFFTYLKILRLSFLGYISPIVAMSYEEIPGDIFDKAIVAASQNIKATICTKDIKDLGPASKYSVDVKTPAELIKLLTHDDSVDINDFLGGFYHSVETGTFIFDFAPSFSSNMQSHGKEPFFNIDGVGYLYFDFSDKHVVFELENGFTTRISATDIQPLTKTSIRLSYDNKKGISLMYGDMHKHNSQSWNCNISLNPNVQPMHDNKGQRSKYGIGIASLRSYPNYMKKKHITGLGTKTVAEQVDRISLDEIFSRI